MKVQVDAVLKDLDGEPIRDGVRVDRDGNIVDPGKEATLGRIAANALLAQFPDEQNLSGEEKVRRFQLATKMVRSETGLPIDLKVEDVALAKKCIAKAFGPLLVGQAFELLEGRDKVEAA